MNGSSLIEEVKGFTDQELRVKLTALGMDVGPITGTTRTLYERKLVQMLTGSLPESSNDSVTQSPQTQPEPRSKPSPRNSSPVVAQAKYVTSPEPDVFHQSPAESTIHLIRARKPVSRVLVEEPVSRKSIAHQSTPSSPFPAANAQFRKTEPVGSFMDHVLKYVLFGIVMLVIVYFIVNQEPGNALEHRT